METFPKAIITSESRINYEVPTELKEAHNYFWSNKESLYREALAMYKKVIAEKLSYRDFGVGAAAVVQNTQTGDFTIVSGWNSKERPDAIKHCAEKRIYERAKHEGYDKVIGILVVAQHQIDDETGVSCTTLHPCHTCREMLKDSPLSWSNMPIITMSIPPNEEGSVVGEYSLLEEQHTLDELLKKHAVT